MRLLLRAAAAGVVIALLGLGAVAGRRIFMPLDLEARLMGHLASEGDRITRLTDDTILRDGDGFWISDLTLNRDAHVLVLLLDSAGRLDLLLPEVPGTEPLRLQAGVSHRLPAGDWVWDLDEHPGRETLFVVATRESITSDEYREILASLERETSMSAGAAVRGIAGSRGLSADRERLEQAVEERLREQFPVVRRYSFQHAPARR